MRFPLSLLFATLSDALSYIAMIQSTASSVHVHASATATEAAKGGEGGVVGDKKTELTNKRNSFEIVCKVLGEWMVVMLSPWHPSYAGSVVIRLTPAQCTAAAPCRLITGKCSKFYFN